MSEPCVFCGGYSPTHSETCPKYTPPLVYDLAEFERQLSQWVDGANRCGNESESALAVEIVLGLLKASKREAK